MNIDEIATEYVYAMWALEMIDPDIGAFMDGKDIHELFTWAADIAAQTDTSPLAQRVYAEAFARRIEGK